MRIGSLFSGGVGGLDLAVEAAFDASTAWQLDLVGADVRARHWPDTRQITADVTTVDPSDLDPIDILCGGFPCPDLSVAGVAIHRDCGGRIDAGHCRTCGMAGLDVSDFERSGLYREMLRFAQVLCPQFVVMENVPALLSQWQARLERDWHALGYGLTWLPCQAMDAGAPHRRARVFVVAERGAFGRGVVDVPTDGRWVPDGHLWATPLVADSEMVKFSGKGGNPSLHTQATTPGEAGRRLSPDWVEILQGVPVGWTNPAGPRLHAGDHQGWPRGWWGPEGSWWPGYDYEPARTYPDHENGGPRIIRGRPARLRALGNAVVWQQALLALRAWAAPVEQLRMFA